MLRRVEVVAAVALSFFANAILTAHVLDWVGLALHPWLILALASAGTLAVLESLRTPARATRDVAVFAAVAGGVFALLLWIAGPPFLPPGRGGDLTHHLVLIDYIEQARHLVHDRGLSATLGEMSDYTAGFHVLAVLVGAWSQSDGLHAAYAVVAIAVALKAGLIFVVATRLLPRDSPATPMAVAAVLLLFLPRVYFLGSFAEHSFLAQAVSELFAVGMWWAMVAWNDQPSAPVAAVFGLAGAAAFLTWPVWIGPGVLAFAAIVARRRETPAGDRLLHLAIACAPIAIVAAAHTFGRADAASIAAASGFTVKPGPATIGWIFLAIAAAGAVVSVSMRRTRIILVLLLAILVQAGALYALSRARGGEVPYLSLKMFYLAIYPMAVAGAVALHALVTRPFDQGGTGPEPPPLRNPALILAWSVTLLVAALAVREVAPMPRPGSALSDPVRDAGRWARAHVPPACVDYLVANDDTAYWLHLAVLGNPRASARSLDPGTFDPRKTLVRWVMPGGLPYAIADDVDALPRDIRANVDVLARAGRAAVLKRRGPSSCP